MNVEDSKVVLEIFKGQLKQSLGSRFKNYCKSWFRKQKNLKDGQDGAEGAIRTCIDSRLDEKKDLNIDKGIMFASAAAAAAVPPWFDGNGIELQTLTDLSFPINEIDNAKNIVIMGHTQCGANSAMFKAIVNEQEVPQWMRPFATTQLTEALQNANKRNANQAKMMRLTEKVTTLQSILNLYGYMFKEDDKSSVTNLVNDGKLNIIAAIRSLEETDGRGKQKLYVFDPESGNFKDIEKIRKEYDEKVKKEKSEKHTENKEAETAPILPPAPSGITMQQGASTRTVAQLKMSDIKSGIELLIQEIKNLPSEAMAR